MIFDNIFSCKPHFNRAEKVLCISREGRTRIIPPFHCQSSRFHRFTLDREPRSAVCATELLGWWHEAVTRPAEMLSRSLWSMASWHRCHLPFFVFFQPYIPPLPRPTPEGREGGWQNTRNEMIAMKAFSLFELFRTAQVRIRTDPSPCKLPSRKKNNQTGTSHLDLQH